MEIHRSELPRFLDPHAAFLDLRLVGCKDKHELGEIVSSQVEKLAGMVVEIRDGEIGVGEIGVNASRRIISPRIISPKDNCPKM